MTEAPVALGAENVALFDLGGVLVSDPWESILLTPSKGLADHLELDRGEVSTAARELWIRHCVQPTDEAQYWSELGEELGVVFDLELVAARERELVVANPHAPELLDSLMAHGVRIGIVSDNTAFWYPKQSDLLHLHEYADPDLIFVSYALGVRKSQEVGGLFGVAAQAVDPAATVVIEDRPKNLAQARRHGFQTRHYSLTGSEEELGALLHLSEGGIAQGIGE